MPIGPYDSQIAAVALVHDLTLITHNTVESAVCRTCEMKDWEAP